MGRRGKGLVLAIWNLFICASEFLQSSLGWGCVTDKHMSHAKINVSYVDIPIQGIEKMCELVSSRIVAVYSVKGK